MPIAMTQEQQALQASRRDWAKRTHPIALVRQGASTALPSVLLVRRGRKVRTRATACVALALGTLTGTRQADGGLRVTGETGPLLWSAGHLLALATTDDADGAAGDAWFLLDQTQPGVTAERLAPLDFSRELAAVRLADVAIPPENLLPGLRTDSVRALAATLYAAEAAGLAAWCSGTAADYAGTRRQFGRLIGEFQAVKHLCATMACRAERAAALAWDAARAGGEAPAGHPLAAAAAAALAPDDAVDNAKDCGRSPAARCSTRSSSTTCSCRTTACWGPRRRLAGRDVHAGHRAGGHGLGTGRGGAEAAGRGRRGQSGLCRTDQPARGRRTGRCGA